MIGGMELGRVIRQWGMSTHVGTVAKQPAGNRRTIAGACISTCSLAFLGGRLRYLAPEGIIGVHRYYAANPAPDDVEVAQVLSSEIAGYLEEMGVDVEFMQVSSAVDSASVYPVPYPQLRKLNVVTDGATPVRWSLQSIPGVIYPKGERDTVYGLQKIIVGCDTRLRALGLYGIFEVQGRGEQILAMPRVDIQIDSEPWLDISERSARKVADGFANFVSPLSRDEALAIAKAERVGLILRFTTESPTFLGISGMELAGGRQPILDLISLYN